MLYCFDLDGTLVRSFMRETGEAEDYDQVEVLPRRKEILQTLAAERYAEFALITNQAGVAFGYQTVKQVEAKIGRICAEFGFFWTRPFSVHIAYEHPSATIPEYQSNSDRRKPGPGMLIEACNSHGYARGVGLVYVGDMESDKLAAERANVTYVDATEFFEV